MANTWCPRLRRRRRPLPRSRAFLMPVSESNRASALPPPKSPKPEYDRNCVGHHRPGIDDGASATGRHEHAHATPNQITRNAGRRSPKEGPRVRRLTAGERWIRTIGPRSQGAITSGRAPADYRSSARGCGSGPARRQSRPAQRRRKNPAAETLDRAIAVIPAAIVS